MTTSQAPAREPSALPSRARVVIIGGGVIGASVAYHLTKLGESDVVLIERDKLTSGTTWHAAGLMTCFGSLSETSMAMRQYTRELYRRLEDETGLVEAVVFPDAFRRRGQGFTVGEVVPARGVGDLQDGVVILRWL